MTGKNPFYGATFAERKAIREAAEAAERGHQGKAVDTEADEVEDKAVQPAKATAKRRGPGRPRKQV